MTPTLDDSSNSSFIQENRIDHINFTFTTLGDRTKIPAKRESHSNLTPKRKQIKKTSHLKITAKEFCYVVKLPEEAEMALSVPILPLKLAVEVQYWCSM
jgi:hypothetical protein